MLKSIFDDDILDALGTLMESSVLGRSQDVQKFGLVLKDVNCIYLDAFGVFLLHMSHNLGRTVWLYHIMMETNTLVLLLSMYGTRLDDFGCEFLGLR